jgi:DNA invertase Pin-like site-specific DNA recombinase
MKLVGYARVSTVEQNLDLQIAALTAAGCAEIFADHGMSGADFQRPGLRKTLRHIQAGDMLIVWRLDRLGRSLIDLIETVNRLSRRGCEFRSLTENIDTSSSGGRLLFHVMAAMAEFERSIISERTKAGMEAAKARGAQIGRRPALNSVQIEQAYEAVHALSEPVHVVASRFHVHPKTLSRILSQYNYTKSVVPDLSRRIVQCNQEAGVRRALRRQRT